MCFVIPTTWKHAIIQCVPKKNFDKNDLSTLRDIRVTCVYKVFSRCLCKRLVSFLTNESLLEQIRSARFDLQLNDGD